MSLIYADWHAFLDARPTLEHQQRRWRTALGRLLPKRTSGTGRLAIYGGGQIGQAVFSTLKDASKWTVAAIIDRDPSRLRGRFPVPVIEPEDAGEIEDVDGILMATVPAHYRAIRAACARFAPDIRVVPLFVDTDDAAMSRVIFSSLPKSGTRWVHGILRDVLTEKGFVYRDPDTPLADLPPGSYFRKHLSVMRCKHVLSDPGTRLIYLYRDPRDCCVSWMKHIKYYDDPVTAPFHRALSGYSEQDLLTLAITGFRFDGTILLSSIADRLRETRTWIDLGARTPGVLLLRYEDLIDDIEREAARMAAFLDMREDMPLFRQAVDRRRFEAVTGRKQGTEAVTSGHRKGIVGDWAAVFTDHQKAIFKGLAGDILLELGYERTLDW